MDNELAEWIQKTYGGFIAQLDVEHIKQKSKDLWTCDEDHLQELWLEAFLTAQSCIRKHNFVWGEELKDKNTTDGGVLHSWIVTRLVSVAKKIGQEYTKKYDTMFPDSFGVSADTATVQEYDPFSDLDFIARDIPFTPEEQWVFLVLHRDNQSLRNGKPNMSYIQRETGLSRRKLDKVFASMKAKLKRYYDFS